MIATVVIIPGASLGSTKSKRQMGFHGTERVLALTLSEVWLPILVGLGYLGMWNGPERVTPMSTGATNTLFPTPPNQFDPNVGKRL